ncbi:MAG: C10 family peptidase, partial [Bacteroidaceae bacterium]|nr:C10 family peptidase [Bacteroidaceae bacterium]
MKNFLRVTVLAICAIFMVASVSAQDNYNATTMGEKVYLETASWGQNYPFNKQIFTSYGGSTNAKAGCVPTAYAIVMRYHGFPEEGTAKTLYNCQAPTYVEVTDRVYDFSKMPLTYNSDWTQEQIDEVSKFFSHVLHACFPSSIGTGATTVNEGSDSKVLNDYFNYQLINASYQANFTMEQWAEKLRESIDNGCPVPYAADNSGTGDSRHMFVVDGYTTEGYFHFNFGWNGGSNGWFKLDNITPSQGDNYSWIDGAEHYALFNLAPNRTMRTVTASVSPAGAGTVTVNGSANSAEVMEGITATLVATANSGYTFSHWSKGGTEVGTDMTYRAKVAAEGNDYVANFYTIGSSVNIPVNYDSNMGSVTYNGNIVSATGFNPNEYSEVTLTAEANDGYMFTGWEIVEGTETTESNDNTVTFIAKNGITVNANFALAGGEYSMLYRNADMTGTTANGYCESWTLKNNIGPALKLSSLSGSTAVAALASARNRFYASRSAQGITTTPITYRIEAPEGFVITSYELEYKSGSAGNITVSNATSSETPTDTSTPHTLSYRYTAQARSASNGVSSTEFTLSSTLNSDTYINVTAFNVTLLSEGAEGGESTPTTYTINVTAGEGGTATVNGNSSATVTEDESVTLAAAAANGYIFTGWYKDAEKVSGDANYTFTPTESASYEARFVAKAVSNCNIPTDNTLRYYRFAIAIAPNSYTTDFGSSYDNVKQFWQDCEDFMNEVYVPLGLCFDVVIDQRLLLGTNLPDNNGLPNISGVTDLINNAIGSGSYDVGLCISYRDNSEENTGLSDVNGAYSSTRKANGYA